MRKCQVCGSSTRVSRQFGSDEQMKRVRWICDECSDKLADAIQKDHPLQACEGFPLPGTPDEKAYLRKFHEVVNRTIKQIHQEKGA